MLVEYPRIAAKSEMSIAWPAGPVGSSGRICLSVPTKSTEAVVEDSVLPPGQRDRSGFWYPAGYSDPRKLVRPRRRHHKDETAATENKPTDAPGQ
jgi:hypothetical protein